MKPWNKEILENKYFKQLEEETILWKHFRTIKWLYKSESTSGLVYILFNLPVHLGL